MIIANYTPDEIQWQHVGQTGFLKPGDVEEFTDARGNHILNKWGARGLIKTGLHADVTREQERSMKIYRNFWIRQITNFNRQNEVNRNENKSYVSPTPILREKAQEMEIELIGSWTYTPPANDAKVTALEKEVSTLKGMLTEMVDAIREMKAAPKLPIPTDTEKIISEFRNMKLADFTNWLIDHSAVWQEYPQDVRDYAKQKYEKLNPGEEFILPE